MRTRAAVCWEIGRPWEITELDVAEPGPGEVLVKLEYAGLRQGGDHNITGDFPPGTRSPTTQPKLDSIIPTSSDLALRRS